MRFTRLAILASLLCLLGACSLQKRNYLPGYYVHWRGTQGKTVAKPPKPVQRAVQPGVEFPVSLPPIAREEKIASLEYKPVFLPTGTKTYLDNCDTIVLRNGTEIKAKVYEITSTEIKYKYCNNPGGPNIIIHKNDVKEIRYSNGQKDVFEPEAPASSNSITNQQLLEEMYIKKQAQSSMVLGILSVLFVYIAIITGIVAIIRARRALEMIGNNPMMILRYRGQARAGLILGIISLCLLALALVAILA